MDTLGFGGFLDRYEGICIPHSGFFVFCFGSYLAK